MDFTHDIEHADEVLQCDASVSFFEAANGTDRRADLLSQIGLAPVTSAASPGNVGGQLLDGAFDGRG